MARGDADDASDVDLIVHEALDNGWVEKHWAEKLRRALEAALERPVDIISLHEMPKLVRASLNAEKIKIFDETKP